jgi:hypothetical protein
MMDIGCLAIVEHLTEYFYFFSNRTNKRQKLLPETVSINDMEYALIRVLGDGRCLFRCVATFGFSDLRTADRNCIGLPIDSSMAHKETEIADKIRKSITQFLSSQAESLLVSCETMPFILDKNIGASYNSLNERLEYMATSSEYAGFLEMSALSLL